MRRAARTNIYSRRIRLSSREIAIALALTIAAGCALFAAIGSVRDPLEAPLASALKEPSSADSAAR